MSARGGHESSTYDYTRLFWKDSHQREKNIQLEFLEMETAVSEMKNALEGLVAD